MLDDDVSDSSNVYVAAFITLGNEVQQLLLKGMFVEQRPKLTSSFNGLLRANGVKNPSYRSEKLKRCLWYHFGEQLVFPQPDGVCQPCIVYAAGMTAGQVAECMVKLQNKESSSSSEDDVNA